MPDKRPRALRKDVLGAKGALGAQEGVWVGRGRARQMPKAPKVRQAEELQTWARTACWSLGPSFLPYLV
eukprot:171230-Pelagomonas_calceolata.AAC.2